MYHANVLGVFDWGLAWAMALQLEDDTLANKILLALPRATLQRISSHLELVTLQQGQVISHPEARIQKIYFINRGLVSLVRSMRDGRSVEIGAIGIEGVTGLGALFGIPEATLESVVQLPGSVEAATLRTFFSGTTTWS